MAGNGRYYDSHISLADDAAQSFLDATPLSAPPPRRWREYWTCAHYIFTRTAPNIVEGAPIFLRDVRRISYVIVVTGLAIISLACVYGWAQADGLKAKRDTTFGEAKDWAACVNEHWSCCFYFAPDNAVTQNNFAEDAAVVGIYTVVFAGLAAAVAHRAFKHYEWLPSSVAMLLYAQLCILSFYPSATMIPTPQSLTSSLAIMTHYMRGEPYSGISAALTGTGGDVDEHACDKAQRFNVAYICLQYVLVGCLFLLLLVCSSGEYVRQKSPKRNRYPRLAFTLGPRMLAVAVVICYITSVFARSVVAFTSYNQFRDRSDEIAMAFPSTTYPFITSQLDVTTILLASGAMAVIRGNTRQSVSALRVSALTSLFYVVLLFPTFLGNFHSAVIFDLLGSGDSCRAFFDINYGVNGEAYKKLYEGIFPWPYDGDTDEDAQAVLCAATRTSLFASTMIFVLQCLQFGVSGYAYLVNQHRQSEILDYSYPHLASPLPYAAEPDAVISKEVAYEPPPNVYGDSTTSRGSAFD